MPGAARVARTNLVLPRRPARSSSVVPPGEDDSNDEPDEQEYQELGLPRPGCMGTSRLPPLPAVEQEDRKQPYEQAPCSDTTPAEGEAGGLGDGVCRDERGRHDDHLTSLRCCLATAVCQAESDGSVRSGTTHKGSTSLSLPI